MRIALFQGPFASAGVAANLQRLSKLAVDAAGLGAGLLVCPEMFLTGYAIGPEAVRRLAEPVDGPSAARAAAIARAGRHRLALRLPRAGRGRPRLQCGAPARPARPHRSPTTARPISTATLDRDAFSRRGRPADVAELDGVRLGILICYDVEFPENVRLLALAGVELVAVPTANMAPFDFVADSLVPDPRLREPAVPGLRQPLRPRGRARPMSAGPASSAPTGSTSPAPARARS